MRKWGIAAGVLTVVLGALFFMRPYATRDREVISSTPAAPSLFTAPVSIELKAKDQLCLTNLPIDEDSEMARLVLYTYGQPTGSPLAVQTSGPGYKFDGTRAGDYKEGPVELP